jgi:DNA-binding MarR family transcriptional regulator
MNYFPGQDVSHSAVAAEQAVMLANLTRSLAECCTGKEAQLFGHYGLAATEGHLLLIVAGQKGISPSAAADRLGVARSRLTLLAQSLEEKGFVVRGESRTDGRAQELRLTAKGKAAARGAAELREQFHARLLESFAPDERDMLLGALGTLHERMRALREEYEQNPNPR